jgi:serine phosphatase RsbU (regulator of sigma subunit)
MRKSKKRLEEKNAEIQKSNVRLSRQQQEIQEQKSNIQQQNRNLQDAYQVIEKYNSKITDSIKYAERIQNAILSSLGILSPFFEDYFCYYKPKDYVSGDFYWLSTKNDKLILAVADCTGHGVPGAFMSIIGMDLLNQAINQQNILDPSQILTFLNTELRNKLKREENEVFLKDSMDIAICTISKKENVMQYSGALVPLIVVRGNRIFDYRPNFVSIGTSTETFNVSFKQQNIELKKGDWIYLYSDGIIDQFGGKGNKKFMRQQLWDSLISINELSGEKQKESIEKIFLDWKGSTEQTDDILLLGLKF